MAWRRLLRFRSRLRDLGLVALVADHLITGLGSWLAMVAGLAIAGAVTMAMATAATTHAKAVNTENRVNAIAGDYLPRSGGTITGDLHISGSIYGQAGTLTCGDSLYVSNAMTAVSTITTHGAFRGGSTTGVGAQGVLSDSDPDSSLGAIPGSQTLGGLIGNCNTIIGRVNNLKGYHNQLCGDTQATVNRVNDLLNALG